MEKARSDIWVLMNYQQTEPYRLLDVEVVRCLLEPHRYRWRVLEQGRRLAGASSQSYATEAEAFYAGNAAARAIRRAGGVRATRH
jgi:hypothetical protein